MFRDRVAPLLERHFLFGKVISAEEVTDKRDFVRQLDILAGIDAWHIIDGYGMRGIASRVQECDPSWDTFTIRWDRSNGIETERHKRLRAIHNKAEGLLLPHITVQAYVTPETVRIGLVNTEALFLQAENHLKENPNPTSSKLPVYFRKNNFDGNRFLVVSWRWIRIAESVEVFWG
jgi:hypothetical protein